ncbi:MAG: FAD-dependent oxidoreductase [Clostridia bacterium]|nr:FAD-dependent oxidoreductase [Clostridia bacterium]
MIYLKEVFNFGDFDTVVCGGGFSGFAAAYSAAREGLKTLIVERGSCLGGVGTAGLVNHILGQRRFREGKLINSIKGIFCELEKRLLDRGHAIDSTTLDPYRNPHGWYESLASGLIFDNEYMKALLEEMLSEKNVAILYYTDIVDVIKIEDRITHIIIHNKDGLQSVSANTFIDATGDGDICNYAGVPFDLGDNNNGLAAASLEMHVDGVDKKALEEYMYSTEDFRFRNIIKELKEKGIWKYPYEIFISVNLCDDDVFFINTIRQVGINGIRTKSLTKGTIDGRKENLELLEIMKKHFPGFENAKIRQIAPVIGIRETRRIRGEYTLTVQDLIDSVVFPDSIAVSSYGWDLPHPKYPSLQPSDNVKRRSPYTHIPYRCLLPLDVSNLIMAGRCISCEREVLGPIRVMGPCLAMGEAAGIAAKIAPKGNFKKVNIAELQYKIQQYGGITFME